MNQVAVKFLILKFGKLLLHNDPEQGVWSLIGGNINTLENLFQAVSRITVAQSGWQADNIRFFKLNSFIDEDGFYQGVRLHEIIFIVDAVKNILPADKRIKNLRWFPLNDLPPSRELNFIDAEIIYAFKNLIHAGKTLDLENLPPAFKLKKIAAKSKLKLLDFTH